MNEEKLNFVEASFLVVIILISHIILDFPNMIIQSQHSASIINVIYISILTLIYFGIIHKLFKPFAGQTILGVADFVGGKKLKIFLGVMYSFALIFISSMIIRGFAETLKVVYFPKASLWIILLMFVLLAIISNKFGDRNIIKINTLLMPFILFTTVIIFVSLLNNFQLYRIFPIMGNGFTETFIKGAENIYSFSGILILFMVRPNLKKVNDYKKVGITSILLCAVYLLLSVASLLFLFPFLTAGNSVLSVYLSTCTIRFGRFMPRTDALFMFMWIFTFILYLSVIIMYVVKINKESIGQKSPSVVTYIVGIIILVFALLPQNALQISFFQNVLFKYISLIIVFGLSFVILLIGYMKKKKLKEST